MRKLLRNKGLIRGVPEGRFPPPMRREIQMENENGGGGGNLTRVRRCVRAGVYVRSLSFRIRPAGPRQTSFPASLGAGRTLSGGCAAPAVRGPLSAPYPASGPSRVRRVAFVRRQVPMVRWQLCCDRLLTRPTGQPRHAACVSTPPSKPCRPRAWERHGQRKGLYVVIMPQEPASGKRGCHRNHFRRRPARRQPYRGLRPLGRRGSRLR